MYFCFDFAKGDVDQFDDGESDDYDYVFPPNSDNNISPPSSSNSSYISESAILLAAADVDTWAVEHLQWLMKHMKLVLLEHFPECIAWIVFAIDRLQQEHDRKHQQEQEQNNSSNSRSTAPQHPGVLWSTQL